MPMFDIRTSEAPESSAGAPLYLLAAHTGAWNAAFATGGGAAAGESPSLLLLEVVRPAPNG